ncbi:ABC transporter ATP-binding protein [Paenibacillus sp. 1P07SE]|uniref:ABC transporter ATP-binding protein n=1 Tax=Paenibacillus sp. 1P07SE TaxID=3132209 RepID=UPI0039A64DA9
MNMRAKLTTRMKRLLEIGEMKEPLKLIYGYMKRYKTLYIELFVFMLIGIALTISYTWFLKQITDSALLGDVATVRQLILMGVLFILLNGIINYRVLVAGASAVQQVKRDLKSDLLHHMLRLPAGYYNKHHSGQMVSHLTNDVNGMDGAIGTNVLEMIRLPLMAIAAFAYLATINMELTLICVIIGPIAAVAGGVFGKLLRRRSREIQGLLSRIQVFLNDTFSAHTVIRAFMMQKRVHQTYSEHNESLLQLEMRMAKLRGWFQVGSGAAGTVAFFMSMGLGAVYVAQSKMSVGSLLAFVSLMQYLISPMTGMASLWGAFQRSIAVVERLVGLLRADTESRSLPDPVQAVGDAPSLSFHDVTFGYEEGESVFERFNLEVPGGTVVALVGPSGSGKSTLFNLTLGFYPPGKGSVCMDGTDTMAMPMEEWRSRIAYVPQETYLFTGTIGDNIGCGREGATMAEIEQAAIAAGIHSFISALPDGYETEVGERGVKLSGGQRQRIAIARAILKDAPILLLDEATSALDSETEQEVQEALERLMENRTTLVIAHRLSTIKYADTIVVLDDGKIVEQGAHHQLMESKGLYHRLYNLQYKQQDRGDSLRLMANP